MGRLTGLLSLLILASCVEKEYDFSKIGIKGDFAPSVAIPIAEGSISITQLFPNDTSGNPIVKEDQDKLLHIYYSKTLATISYGDFVGDVADQHQAVSLLPAQTIIPVNTPIRGSTTLDFPLALTSPDQIIERVVLDRGLLSVDVSSNMEMTSASSLTISSDDIVLANGESYHVVINPSSSGSTVSLSGATVKTSSLNKVKFLLSYAIEKRTSSSTFDKIMLNFGLTQMKAHSTVGYLGRKLYNLNMKRIDFNYGRKIFESESALIEAPVVKLEFKNGIDVPFEYQSSKIEAYGKKKIYNILGFPANTFIEKGSLKDAARLVSSFATFENAADLISVLSKFPDYLNFSGNIISNPKGQIATNVVGEDDRIEIKGYVDLPMQVLLKNVVLYDTVKYDFNDIATSKDIDYFKLMLTLNNGYPVDFRMNAYVLNDAGTTIDSLFTAPVAVKSGVVANGIALSSVESTAELEFSQSRLQGLKDGKSLAIRAVGTTFGASEGAKVKILSTNGLKIKVVGAVRFKLKN